MNQGKTDRPTIVCVDDDTLVLRSLREQLQRGLGTACNIELADSGTEALQLLDELASEGADVPLLISDQIMPGMHGAQLMAQVHERYPAMLKIMLTGQADAEAVGHAVNRASLYRMLSKPWQEHDLVMTVQEALYKVEQEKKVQKHAAALELSHKQLEQSVELLHATMDATMDGILVIDCEGKFVQCNHQFLDLWTVPQELARLGPAIPLATYLHSQLAAEEVLHIDGVEYAEDIAILRLNNSRFFEYSSRAHRVRSQQIGVVYSFRDVTDRERSAALIHRQALYDTLTGVANRFQFDEALKRALKQAHKNRSRLGVMYIDLDRFKRINDTLGHAVGDALLRCVAEKLQRCVRSVDLVSRWGGDEFTILLKDLVHEGEAANVAQRIVDEFKAPLTISEHEMQVSASIGIAIYPDEAKDAESLLTQADLALYQVKQNGRNGYQRYRANHKSKLSQPLSLETDLCRALEQGGFEIHYQPQVDTRSGQITHVEALARWHHQQLGWISPDKFIPLIEEMGLIVPFGEWALFTALSDAAHWHAVGYPEVIVAVNISATQLKQNDFLMTVRRLLTETGLPGKKLELEITETVALHNLEHTAQDLTDLQSGGIQIALDDFGTGFGSLSYLQQLPCQTLKIDRTFIKQLGCSDKGKAIISAVVTLAKGFGLRLIAEGVETKDVQDSLQKLGCWNMQGYLFSKAVPSNELLQQLADSKENILQTAF